MLKAEKSQRNCFLEGGGRTEEQETVYFLWLSTWWCPPTPKLFNRSKIIVQLLSGMATALAMACLQKLADEINKRNVTNMNLHYH